MGNGGTTTVGVSFSDKRWTTSDLGPHPVSGAGWGEGKGTQKGDGSEGDGSEGDGERLGERGVWQE